MTQLLYALEEKNILDKYHDSICFWLVNTSNSIDDYFFDLNSSDDSSTRAEIKSSFSMENHRKSEYAMRLKLRLNLPKIQKKLRLILEDEDSDDLLYDNSVLNNNLQQDNKNYFLRVEYFNYMLKELNVASGVGVRFRKKSLHPYLNIKTKYFFEDKRGHQSLLLNRFRLYVNGDVENISGYEMIHDLAEHRYILFKNTFGYKSFEETQKILNDIRLVESYGKVEQFTLGVSLLSELKEKDLSLLYPQLYGVYRNNVYRDWIYYEINPSLLFRKENNNEPSMRLMINIGTVF
jgi:hypothetical protein